MYWQLPKQVCFSTFRIFPTLNFRWILRRGLLFVLGLVLVFAYMGFQFPTDPTKDQFLSSVISMVAPTWCHGPTWGNPCGECWTELTSEFTIFNLGIHLRNLEQLAFFRVSPVAAVGWTNCSLCLGFKLFRRNHADSCKTSFFHFARETASGTCSSKATGTWLFPLGVVSLVFSVRLTSCAT